MVSEQRHHHEGAERSEGDSPDTLQVVVFVVDGQRYALPLAAAERVVSMVAISPLPDAPDSVCGAVNVHGEVTPVLDLRRRLGLPSREHGLESRLLLARTPHRVVALPVDEVQGVAAVTRAQVVSPESVAPGLATLAGIAALPDGLLLIDDPSAFFSLEDEHRLDEAIDRAGR